MSDFKSQALFEQITDGLKNMDEKEKKDIQKVRAPSRVPRRSTAPCSAAAAMCGGGRASVYAACRSPSTLPARRSQRWRAHQFAAAEHGALP